MRAIVADNSHSQFFCGRPLAADCFSRPRALPQSYFMHLNPEYQTAAFNQAWIVQYSFRLQLRRRTAASRAWVNQR